MTRLFAPLLVVFIAGCSADSGVVLVAEDVRVTAPRPGTTMSAGYLKLANRSDAPVTLTSVDSPQFGRVEMHETVISDGIARMRRMESLTIGAGDAVRFEPGGKHLMLMEPDEPLDEVTVYFYADGAIMLTVHASPQAD